MALNFELLSALEHITLRNIRVLTTDLVNPYSAAPLADGEWVEIVSATDYHVRRNAGFGLGGAQEGTIIPWVVWAEKGRTDTQAMAEPKVPLLFLGPYEAITSICDTTGVILGSLLTVQDVTVAAVVYRGLALRAAGFTVGYATRVFTDGRIQFVRAY